MSQTFKMKERSPSMPKHPTEKPSQPRTLVAGGAGFLGSHICERLIAEGHDVICLDNLITGSLDNISPLFRSPRFTFIRHDITTPIDLPSLIERSQPGLNADKDGALNLEYILDLASPASPKDYGRHPIHTLKVGALGTYHTLGLARAYGSVFLLASTSEVYGDPEMAIQSEEYWGHVNPIGPRSVYDEAKRYAEAITMAYRREHRVNVRIARIFNTYGERMRPNDGRAMPAFIMQALNNEPLTVYGNGAQTRSFCYVSDMVEGILRLLFSEETGPINLGNPEELSILDLAREIIRQTRSESSIIFEPLPQDDPQRRRPAIALAQRQLDWCPQVPLADGLARTIGYFESAMRERPSNAPEVAIKYAS